MKRIYVGALLCAILSLGLLTGCDQGVARSFGGDMTLELEPGQKLEMITWKDGFFVVSHSANARWRGAGNTYFPTVIRVRSV